MRRSVDLVIFPRKIFPKPSPRHDPGTTDPEPGALVHRATAAWSIARRITLIWNVGHGARPRSGTDPDLGPTTDT